ncbi:MAG: imidazole glycerol phosphate synthase cyclase subunit [Negativicutes bacterium]|jgi:cyclase
MRKNRVIPVVLLKNGVVVQSKGFKRYQILGNPFAIVDRLSDWAADELIYLDISREATYDLGRDDLKCANETNIIDILREVAKSSFMPLTFGGRIRNIDDVYKRVTNGADKVTLNSEAFRNPMFISECARIFGSQCIVVSIDAGKNENGNWQVFIDGGKTPTGITPAEWSNKAQECGAGEILINSINNDGMGCGYDIQLIASVVSAVNIPVIACGGVGKWEHLAQGITDAGADAVAAANIFHYSENSVYDAKKYLYEKQINVRKPTFGWE